MSIKGANFVEADYRDKIIYLAVPYTSRADTQEQRQLEREDRFNLITEVSGIMIREGVCNFSPITQSHEQAKAIKLPTHWEFWRNIDIMFLKRCDEIWILQIPGWRTSIGVQSELSIALAMDIPVKYIDYDHEKGRIVVHEEPTDV